MLVTDHLLWPSGVLVRLFYIRPYPQWSEKIQEGESEGDVPVGRLTDSVLVVGPVVLRACRPIPPVGTWPVPITTNLKLGGVLPSTGPADLPASSPLARSPMG